MKVFFLTLLSLCSAWLGALQEVVSIPDPQNFQQYWQLVEEKHQELESLQEWVPIADSDEARTKSFGIQLYQLEEDYDLKHFYTMFVETLERDFEDNESSFLHETHSESPEAILFSWWSEPHDHEVGKEWVHLMKDDHNRVLFVRFATKSFEESAEDDVWRECLKQVTFKDIQDDC